MGVLRLFWEGFRDGWREATDLPDWVYAAAFVAGGAIFLVFGMPALD